MTIRSLFFLSTALGLFVSAGANGQEVDSERDILVTFENDGASAIGGGVSAPYRNRVRYSIAATARRSAIDIADQYSLVEIDHWPIRSLSIYCFVYRIPAGMNRDGIINQLQADNRVESVQPLQEFETGTQSGIDYNDEFVKLQYGLDLLGITEAHRYSLGAGVRIAIIDGNADTKHEDLQGRFRRIEIFSDPDRTTDLAHGTAVASVIGARVNNSVGIVGIAPEASLELFVSCWRQDDSDKAICDSFTLAKALDALLENPPDILNLSLNGPDDALVKRLIEKAAEAGVIVVAASAVNANAGNRFPANLNQVIGVNTSEETLTASNMTVRHSANVRDIHAPGIQIMVAVPNNAYDFRSGSSLAAAHVSGVIALLLANSPDLPFETILEILQKSQAADISDLMSVNACVALTLADNAMECI